MNLLIENIGTVKNADIKLNGLTIIAGENDTGKSTVGRLLFSIVKAVNRYEQDLKENKSQIILRKIERLYFKIRPIISFSKHEKIQELFNPRNFARQIDSFINIQASLFPVDYSKDIELIFQERIDCLKGFEKESINSIIKSLDDIKHTILKEEKKEDVIKRALSKVFFSEFYSELSTKGCSNTSIIKCFEGENLIFDVEINDNNITSFNLHDVLLFNDVTFIETPVILQMYDVIRYAGTLLEIEDKEQRMNVMERPKVSLHIKDLVGKLENAKYFADTFYERGFSIDTIKRISNIINGGFTFEKDDRDFLYSKHTPSKKNIKVRSVNTASGIKSFGMIQLLLQSNILDERSLLIIDEPENHLHPKWQVEYAKLIVELVKNDINVLISSHSPYMIQAIKFFSEKYEITEKVSYYLAEVDENENLSEINNVTDNLNKIFVKLAEPLQELVWK